MAKRGFEKISITLHKRNVDLYAGVRVRTAIQEITKNMNLYKGVRLMQVLEAFYLQGRKDGARHAFDEVHRSLKLAQRNVPHRRPGRPRARR